MSPTSLENDMVCLIDSLNFLEDDGQQQQALEHLADMCLQDGGAELFRKTNGLSMVFKLVLARKTPSQVLQKAMFTLGNASLINDENKRSLCSDKMLHYIQSTLLDKNQNMKMIASTAYFLACLCTNDEKAQNNVRKLKCLDKLVALYRFFHPKGHVNNLDVEQWFDRPQSSSVIVLNHISHALKSIINKPKNAENQLICSRLLSLAVSTLSSSSTSQTKVDALQFITDCLHENEKTQQIFNMIGGLRCLSQCLKGESARSETQNGFLSVLLDTLNVATFGNSTCKKSVGEFGVIETILHCLSRNSTNDIVLKSLICLSELVHECESCQEKLLKADGIRIVIEVMSEKQDEITSKIGTTILQTCVKNVSDLYDHGSNEEKEKEKPKPTLSNFLQFLTGSKKEKAEKRPRDQEKSLNILLRSLKMSGIDQESSEIKQLIRRIEDGNLSAKKVKKSNIRQCNVSATKNTTQVEEDMVAMLKEQKEFLQQFKNDFNNLRSEIASQVSDCGDSCSARILNTHHPSLTPRKNAATSSTSNFAPTPSGIPRPKIRCVSSVPMKRKQLSRASHSTHEHISSTPTAKHRKTYVLPEMDCVETSKAVHGRCLVNVDKQHVDKRPKDDDISSLGDSWIEVDHIQDDERPALNNAKYSGIFPLIYENVSYHDQARSSKRNNSTRLDVTSPTAFEKVERWRQSLNPLKPNKVSAHAFKVPTMTPLMKRRRLSGKLSNSPRIKELSTPSLDEKQYDQMVQNAPMKVLLTKRRRPFSYQNFHYTPEPQIADHWDRTKRTLNFDSYTNKLKRAVEERDAPSPSCVSSRTYPDSTSHTDCQEQSVKHSQLDINQQTICIGCNPFSRLIHLNTNSHNLKTLMRGDRYTCHFHLELFKKPFLTVDETDNRKPFSLSTTLEKSYRQNKSTGRKLDSMSVFSFRSDHTLEDAASICSGYTANTIKRRRRKEYSKEETQNILKGVNRYGTRWTAILNSYSFKRGRTSEDLRSKYKQLRRQIYSSHGLTKEAFS